MKKIVPLLLSVALLASAASLLAQGQDVRLKAPSGGIMGKTVSGGSLMERPATETGPLSVGPSSPGTVVDNSDDIPGETWVSPDNIEVNDAADATAGGGLTSGLAARNFGFALPVGAVVVGLVVEIEKNADDPGVIDSQIQVFSGDVTAIGDNKATATAWNASPGSYVTHGSPTDDWGLNAAIGQANTRTLINSANFTIMIVADATTGTAAIDHVRVTVYYE